MRDTRCTWWNWARRASRVVTRDVPMLLPRRSEVGAREGRDARDRIRGHVEHEELREGVRGVLEDVKLGLDPRLPERRREHLGVGLERVERADDEHRGREAAEI